MLLLLSNKVHQCINMDAKHNTAVRHSNVYFVTIRTVFYDKNNYGKVVDMKVAILDPLHIATETPKCIYFLFLKYRNKPKC